MVDFSRFTASVSSQGPNSGVAQEERLEIAKLVTFWVALSSVISILALKRFWEEERVNN